MVCILVIDDDQQLRLLFRQLLERAGYEVVEASDGCEGVQCFQARPMDLVITDLLMPKQNGFETIRMLQTLAPSLKIIAVSGGGTQGSSDVLHVAAALGAHRTLQKPVRLQDLLGAVQQLLAEP